MTGTTNAESSERAAFMARVRAALGRSATSPPGPSPPLDDSSIRRTRPTDALVPIFSHNAGAAGMVVHPTTTANAGDRVRAVISGSGARRIAIGAGPTVEKTGIRQWALQADVSPVDWQADRALEPLYDADAGITGVYAAVAETGSLVCTSEGGQGRGLSLVPPIHIAIVRASDIVPDLIDVFARQEPLPSSIVLITGPSKTADIEGILITGVHGPREVHVVLVEDA